MRLSPSIGVFIAGAAVALTLTGCSIVPPVIVGPSSASSPQAADEETRDQRRNLFVACSTFETSMNQFNAATRAAAAAESVEQYAAALKDFSYALGDQSLDAGDTGDVGLDLLIAHLATETAATADEYLATGELSTTRWLAFRTGVKAVGDPCGQTWTFDE